MSARRTAIAAALVVAAGVAAAYFATDRFEAYTLESARRLAALNAPAAVPDLALEIAGAGRTRLDKWRGQVLLVDFIYTSCPTYCAALGSVYAQLQQRLGPEIAAGTVRLVSVSFDPAHDGPTELAAYRLRYSRDTPGWDLGRPVHAGELKRWLDTFGIVVIPDGLGGYAHNAAVHVVGPDSKLVAILGFDDLDGIVNTTRRFASGSTAHVALR